MYCRSGIPSMLVIQQCTHGCCVRLMVLLKQATVPAWQALVKFALMLLPFYLPYVSLQDKLCVGATSSG